MKKSCGIGQQNICSQPDVYFVLLNFVSAFVDNQSVQLPKKYTKCCKLSSNLTTNWPQNNVFLHFNKFTDTLLTGNNTQGRLLQLGGVPWVFPLELATRGGLYVYRIGSGFPSTVYLSADYQGNGAYTDVIAFFGDDVDIINFK